MTYGSSIHAEYNASERKEHLLKIYNKKGCAQPKDDNYQKLVSETLIKLEDIKIKYNQGIIDEENYFEMRRKLLVNFE